MGASVRIEASAFNDSRFHKLGRALGVTRWDALARMAAVWSECTDREQDVLDLETLSFHLGCDDDQVVDALCNRAELGEITTGGDVRVRGCRGRIEWLAKQRANGRKGGRPKESKTNHKTNNPTVNPHPKPTQKPTPNPPKNPTVTATVTAIATATATEDTPNPSKGNAGRGRPGEALGEAVTRWLNAELGKNGTNSFFHMSKVAHRAGKRWHKLDWTREQVQGAIQLRIAELRNLGNHAYLVPQTLFNTRLEKYIEMARQGTTAQSLGTSPGNDRGYSRVPTQADFAADQGKEF